MSVGRMTVTVEKPEILLVSCYELGHQPMGLASPMAFLARAGFPVTGFDISVDPLEKLDADLVRRARLVAISVPMHTALRLGSRVAERIREMNPRSHICFYGLYATLNRDYLLQNGADSILGGEFEQSLVALAEGLAQNGNALPTVSEPVLERLRFPVPLRRGLPPLEKYAHLEREEATAWSATSKQVVDACIIACIARSHPFTKVASSSYPRRPCSRTFANSSKREPLTSHLGIPIF